MEIKKQNSDYLIELIKAVIKETKPMEKPAEVDWTELLELAHYHKVEEMALYAISQLENKPEGDEAGYWFNYHNKNNLLNMLQTEEADLLVNAASEAGLDILPLKGFIMKSFYPRPEFRQMGDLDFLVEAKHVNDFRPIMRDLGYEETNVGLEDSHDVYEKKPYMEIEIHRRLLPPTEENHWHTDDIWQRLVRDEKNPHLMHMTWEDYYLFHLLHFEKHYSMGGCGIRFLIDQHYLMKAFKDTLDWDYINEILPKMNYVEFEKMVRELTEVWFGDREMTKELEGPAEFIINSGVFGDFEHYQKWCYERYQRELGIKSKTGFFFRRMFMERERMEFSYPILKKHGWLLPFLWIHRLFKAVLFNRDRVMLELDNFKDEKDKD